MAENEGLTGRENIALAIPVGKNNKWALVKAQFVIANGRTTDIEIDGIERPFSFEPATIAVHMAEPLPDVGAFARIKRLVFEKGRLKSEETVHEKAGLLLG